MTRPPRYADLTPEQREAFDRRYGPPSPSVVSPTTVATLAHATFNGVPLGPDSPLHAAQKPRRYKRGHEDIAHMAVIRWADSPVVRDQYPDLAYLFHPANGGARDSATAGKLKAMGVRRGVPDLLLPVPRGRYVGCAIELKVWKGSHEPADPTDPTKYRTMPSENQLDWLDRLQRSGWHTSLQWGAEAAITALRDYLNL